MLTEIQTETGIPTIIHQHEIIEPESITKLYSWEDIQTLYPTYTHIAHGDIFYTGWDIPDKWAAFQKPNGAIELWYSSDAHGFGMKHHIKEGETNELEKFYLSEEAENACSLSFETVLSSWKH